MILFMKYITLVLSLGRYISCIVGTDPLTLYLPLFLTLTHLVSHPLPDTLIHCLSHTLLTYAILLYLTLTNVTNILLTGQDKRNNGTNFEYRQYYTITMKFHI